MIRLYHGFCDASPLTYGACIYLRFQKLSGDTICALVSSKSRVAQISKRHTIPRLELLGGLLLAKLITLKVLNLAGIKFRDFREF